MIEPKQARHPRKSGGVSEVGPLKKPTPLDQGVIAPHVDARHESSYNEGVDDGDRWKDGVWVGPRSLRFFLVANGFFVAFWFLVITGIALGFWFDVADVSSWVVALPLAMGAAAAVTAGLLFGFSRG